jgi:small subunit ribosomal protein SAe
MNLSEADIQKMVVCSVHLGSENLDVSMSRYVYGRNADGVHIIDLRKTWEKLQLAARVIVAIDNPRDVCAVALAQSSKEQPPHAQRAVLKFAKYTRCRAVAARFTPGTFTNQIQAAYFEPRVLIASDPLKDHQPIMESSYCNMPVIAFANTNANMRHVDIAIPCNTDGKHSIALMYWMLTREVLRLRGEIPRTTEWDVMVDMFVYRDPEEAEKTDENQKSQAFNWNVEQGGDTAEYPDAPAGGYDGQDGDWGTNTGGEWGAGNESGYPDEA